MTNPQTDYSAIVEKWRAERDAAIKTARTELLAALRALDVAHVIADVT
ncbi:MAG: hypothetical protein AAFR47_15055 [Pseudomonadota bacterium]